MFFDFRTTFERHIEIRCDDSAHSDDDFVRLQHIAVVIDKIYGVTITLSWRCLSYGFPFDKLVKIDPALLDAQSCEQLRSLLRRLNYKRQPFWERGLLGEMVCAS